MRNKASARVAATLDALVHAVTASLWFTVLGTLVALGVATVPLAGLGVFVLAGAVALARWGFDVERGREASVHRLELAASPRPRVVGGRPLTRPLRQARADLPVVGRFLLHQLAMLAIGSVVFAAVSTFGMSLGMLLTTGLGISTFDVNLGVLAPVVAIVLAVGLVTLVGDAHIAASRSLLAPPAAAALQAQLAASTDQRDRAVRGADVERRRIERDLHDGVQPQLVNVGMMLGMARAKLDTDPDAARALLAEAHGATQTAIKDLRQLARGIHPAILADEGLDAALSALAARVPVPTTLDVHLPGRCDEAAEAAVYFTVAEALANATKHAAASSCAVEVRLSRPDAGGVRHLVAEVRDDGRGGAVVVPQGGLAGLRDRVGAVGGTLDVRSTPAGTSVTAVVPCA